MEAVSTNPVRRARSTRRWRDKVFLGYSALTFVLMLVALYLDLIYAPADATQQNVGRILYFHVPVALMGFLAFSIVFIASIAYLWRGNMWWDVLARSSAEVGLVFTTFMLITGSLWGKPIWGTWWTWDPRLTTSLILWFIYLGYLMLRSYSSTPEQAARNSAVVGIIGFVDVPIVYLATTWWRTLHPAPVLSFGGARMPPQMAVALLASLIAFTLLFFWLLVQKMRIETLSDKLNALQMTGWDDESMEDRNE